MSDPVVFTQRFRPKARGFAIVGPVMMAQEVGNEAQLVAEWFSEGIAQHPKGKYWDAWRNAAQQIAAGDAGNPRA